MSTGIDGSITNCYCIFLGAFEPVRETSEEEQIGLQLEEGEWMGNASCR